MSILIYYGSINALVRLYCGRLCAAHRLSAHVNLKARHCAHASCTRTPSYGPLNGKPRFCAAHRQVLNRAVIGP